MQQRIEDELKLKTFFAGFGVKGEIESFTNFSDSIGMKPRAIVECARRHVGIESHVDESKYNDFLARIAKLPRAADEQHPQATPQITAATKQPPARPPKTAKPPNSTTAKPPAAKSPAAKPPQPAAESPPPAAESPQPAAESPPPAAEPPAAVEDPASDNAAPEPSEFPVVAIHNGHRYVTNNGSKWWVVYADLDSTFEAIPLRENDQGLWQTTEDEARSFQSKWCRIPDGTSIKVTLVTDDEDFDNMRWSIRVDSAGSPPPAPKRDRKRSVRPASPEVTQAAPVVSQSVERRAEKRRRAELDPLLIPKELQEYNPSGDKGL